MKAAHIRVFLYSAALLLLGTAFRAAAYRFDGEIKLLSSLADTRNPPKERRKLFKVSVADDKGNGWIHTEVTGPPEELSGNSPQLGDASVANKASMVYVGPEGNRRVAEYGLSNRTLFFKQISFLHGSDLKETGKRPSHNLGYVWENIDISEAEFPPFDSDLCFPVWLAYCSHHFLPEGQISAPPMIWIGTAQQPENVFTITSESKAPGTGFFNEILFQNNGYFPRYSSNMTYAITRFSGGLQPYVEARYHVVDWGMQDGVPFPRRSYFDFYSAPPTKLIKRFILSVTSFSNSPGGLPEVKSTAVALVTDHRLSGANSGPLTYLTTNKLMDVNSPLAAKIVGGRDKKVAREMQDKTSEPLRRTVLLAIMIAMICLPPLSLPIINVIKNKGQMMKQQCLTLFLLSSVAPTVWGQGDIALQTKSFLEHPPAIENLTFAILSKGMGDTNGYSADGKLFTAGVQGGDFVMAELRMPEEVPQMSTRTLPIVGKAGSFRWSISGMTLNLGQTNGVAAPDDPAVSLSQQLDPVLDEPMNLGIYQAERGTLRVSESGEFFAPIAKRLVASRGAQAKIEGQFTFSADGHRLEAASWHITTRPEMDFHIKYSYDGGQTNFFPSGWVCTPTRNGQILNTINVKIFRFQLASSPLPDEFFHPDRFVVKSNLPAIGPIVLTRSNGQTLWLRDGKFQPTKIEQPMLSFSSEWKVWTIRLLVLGFALGGLVILIRSAFVSAKRRKES